ITLYQQNKLELLPGRSGKETLETNILTSLTKVSEECGKIIGENIKDNCVVIMAKSGARGSITHVTQLSACVGQARTLGERMHRGYNSGRRTLSLFKVNDLSASAHGFLANSFKSGLNPIEFFFDAMSGRESLMDKSLRTRHSGYLERRLMNALQDLKVEYDGTVRDNRKVIIQFIPGEDGIDPAKSDWGILDVKSIIQAVLR
ncbi:MAG: DNA-directed RNA polymerase subunit A', partial [Nanoarchaeota archaeon]|nr:DNA-directed RNA polymerase subunit A' [Nanoarchaeota archaeon]